MTLSSFFSNFPKPAKIAMVQSIIPMLDLLSSGYLSEQLFKLYLYIIPFSSWFEGNVYVFPLVSTFAIAVGMATGGVRDDRHSHVMKHFLFAFAVLAFPLFVPRLMVFPSYMNSAGWMPYKNVLHFCTHIN